MYPYIKPGIMFMEPSPQRVLIIRLGAIGDVIRVLPALHALRERYPSARIDWAVESRSAEVLQDHPALNGLLVFHRTGRFFENLRGFLAFARRIRQGGYDLVLDFHGILKSGLLAAASGARRRVGFARPRAQEGSWLFLTERVRLPSSRLNRIEENLELIRAVDARRGVLDVIISVSPDIQVEVEAWFEEKFDSGKLLVAVHAPVDRPEKQWPLEYYAELCDLLLSDGRFEPFLTWGPGQREVAEEVAARCRRSPVIAPETPTLKHLAWLLSRADLFIGGDTGPMHLASAMGTPVVAVFGGTDPAKHHPLREPCVVLDGGPADDPRRKNVDRRNGPGWMRQVSPRSVYEAAVRLVTSGERSSVEEPQAKPGSAKA